MLKSTNNTIEQARRNLEELNFSPRSIEFILRDSPENALDEKMLQSAKRIYDISGERDAVAFLTTD